MKKCVLLVCFSLSSYLFSQKDLKFLNEGTQLIEDGKYEAAYGVLKNAISANTKNSEAYYQLGRCHLYLGKMKDAKQALEKAVNLSPKKASYYNLLGVALESTSDTIGAINNYQIAISLDSSDSRAYINLIRIKQSQLLYREAMSLVDLAITKSKKDPQVYLVKGDIHQGLGDTLEAIKSYKDGLSLDSTSYHLNYAIAIVYSDLELYKECLSYINRAIRKEPENSDGYVEKARCLDELGDSTGAIRNYDKAIELDSKNSYAFFSRANFYRTHGNITAAINDFSKMIQLDPKDADAYLYRGECYADTSNCQLAILDFEKAKKLSPNDPEIYFHIGLCQDETRYYREAIESFSSAIKLDSLNSNYFYSRGNSKYNLELLDEAKTDYLLAIKLDSINTGPLFNLGNIYFDKREYENAIKYYNQYLILEPKDYDAMVNRAICKNALGLDKEACAEWKLAAAAGNFDANENLKKFCK